MSGQDQQYTPPESEFIRAYALGMRQAFVASTGEHEAEARRFLAQVRRDAWDEGYDACSSDVSITSNWETQTENPYALEEPTR